MYQVVGLAVLSSLYKTEKVSIVVSRPDSDNILTLQEKKALSFWECELTIVLKSVVYTMSRSKNVLLIVIDTHKLHS